MFEEGLGTLEGFKAELQVDPNAQPKFCKACSVLYSMKVFMEEEIDRLVKEGTIEPIVFSEWAAPIVPVLKCDKKSVRICGDFKLTVNQAAQLDRCPIPKVQDLFAELAGGQSFTKLDLSQTYQQICLSEESKKYVVINTSKGLFRYNRLPYGVSSAPTIFQWTMESLLRIVYLDDILISKWTESEKEHLSALDEVLSRLERAGLRLKKKKCTFVATEMVYLGHKIDPESLHPWQRKWMPFVQPQHPRM